MVIRPLKGYGSFEEALRKGTRVSSGPLSMTVVFSDQSDRTTADVIFCGVSAPKRIVRKAVLRNRIKRLLREAVRRTVLAQEDRCVVRGITTVIAIWRSAPPLQSSLHMADVLPRVDSALNKAMNLPARGRSA